MIYRVFIVLAVIVAIVGSIMLGRQQGAPGSQGEVQPPAGEQGYSARNAQLIETGADGRPLYTLDADRIRQRPNDGRVQLDVVRMTYRASDGNLWNVRADSGQIREDGAHIELYGHVQVRGNLTGSDVPADITTSILSFDTRAEVLSTHAPVVLRWGEQELEASGLVASLKDRSVRLESRVHGQFSS